MTLKQIKPFQETLRLLVSPVSQSWEEGLGVDLDGFSDLTYDGTGSNWINASANTTWSNISGETLQGGSFLSASTDGSPVTEYDEFNYKQTFESGGENLEVDITGLVEQWIIGTGGTSPSGITGFNNYGVGLFLTASQASSSVRSYYTKRFSARSSEYFFQKTGN